jgi:DedD protein
LTQPRRGYVLQAGVFMSTERAEELRARLLMAGVPVTIESRVQVGPFASAQEAAAAREKIKALGVESIVIPPARPRPAGR